MPTGRCRLHLDLDSGVMPFGAQEGALPGPNPRYRARPSYHPLLGDIAEPGICVGARLCPGDTSLGENDTLTFVAWIGDGVPRARARAPASGAGERRRFRAV